MAERWPDASVLPRWVRGLTGVSPPPPLVRPIRLTSQAPLVAGSMGKSELAALRRRALELSRLMRHRGPDWSGVHSSDRAILAHERLAIVDLETGAQPALSPDGKHALAVNGEIFNHEELEASLTIDYPFQTRSDCEVILALYRDRGVEFLDELRGMFAFVLYDSDADCYLIARDHIGIVLAPQPRVRVDDGVAVADALDGASLGLWRDGCAVGVAHRLAGYGRVTPLSG